MELENLKDKSNFVVALFAAVLALIAFKENLESIKIPLGFYRPNLLHIISLFVIFLGFSAYLYALDYIRYGTRFQNNIIFKWIIPGANLFYFLAMMIPIVTLIAWMVAIISYNISLKGIKINVNFISSLVSVIIGILTSILSFSYVTKKTKDLTREIAEKIEDIREDRLKKANQFYRERFYSASILEAFKILELTLRKKLEERSIYTKNLSINQLLNLAFKKRIISEDILSNIRKVKTMRNTAAHLDISFNKSDADFVFTIIKNVLDELDSEDNYNNEE